MRFFIAFLLLFLCAPLSMILILTGLGLMGVHVGFLAIPIGFVVGLPFVLIAADVVRQP